MTIPLRPGVTVSGLVRESGTERPIPGLVVLIGYGSVGSQVLTDADGRYRCLVPPGPVTRLSGIPNEFAPLDQKQLGPVNVPGNVVEHETPILELERAPTKSCAAPLSTRPESRFRGPSCRPAGGATTIE